MASTMRSVDTRFWSDVWVRQLNALDRYVFLYLLTNSHSSWCGVYELDIGMMAFESGVDEHDLRKSILPRLASRIVYIDGWVYIRNFDKYHSNSSPKTQKGIEAAWNEVPDKIVLKIKELHDVQIPLRRGMVGASPSASASASAYFALPSEDALTNKEKDMKKYSETNHSDIDDKVIDLETGEVAASFPATKRGAAMQKLIAKLAELRNAPLTLTGIGKQRKYIAEMFDANITPAQIADRLFDCLDDDIYQGKVDYLTVAKSFDKLPADKPYTPYALRRTHQEAPERN